MNELAQKQIHEDYREILSSEAGMRVLGGIFVRGGLNRYMSGANDQQRGMHDLALSIALSVYEVNPYGVADCLTAYEDFIKEHSDNERRDDAEPYEYSE